jgi:hypothetical protein
MKKGSKAAKAWGAKMRRLRNKTKSTTKKRKTVRKQVKTKRKPAVKKRKTTRLNKTKNKRKPMAKKGISSIVSSGIVKKVALGLGGAALATTLISVIAPNSQIGKFAGPAGAFALGGIEGVIGSFALNMVAGQRGNNTQVAPLQEVL